MKILVIDTGIGLCHAVRLGRDGHKVYYYSVWQNPYPRFRDFIIGDGFPNIEKVQDWAAYLGEVDFVLFTDCGFGAQADYLRENGLAVCGGGSAETLEMNRREFHQVCDELELKYPESWDIDGIAGVLEFFRKQKAGQRFFVKVNTFRGDCETFSGKSYEEIEPICRTLEAQLGPYAETFEFVIEKEVPGVEIGFDSFFNGRDFLVPIYFTFECWDNTLGKWVQVGQRGENSLDVWDEVLVKMGEYLKNKNYRGPVSFEAIYDGKNLYLLDPTIRFAYPTSSASFCQVIKNYGEVLAGVARGEDVDIDLTSRYAIGMNLHTEENYGRWLVMDVKKGTKFWPRRACVRNNRIYVTPGREGETIVGVVVGEGNNYAEVFRDADAQIEGVSVYGMNYNWGVYDKFKESYIAPLREYGIDF